MDMIVCCKLVVDPELPPANFKVDEAGKNVMVLSGAERVISPFDEQAVEAALRIKDKLGGKITILILGNNLLNEKGEVAGKGKKPLAMGADELILLNDQVFEGSDSWSTAFSLAAAIRKIGRYDLIFCGRQAADWDAGQVGLGIAEFLGIACITLARKIEIINGLARVERIITSGYQVLEVGLPALITVTNELGTPRYPPIRGIMAAAKKKPIVWKLDDLGLTPEQVGARGRRSQLVKIFQPVKEKKCQIIEGKSPAEAGTNLALKLLRGESKNAET